MHNDCQNIFIVEAASWTLLDKLTMKHNRQLVNNPGGGGYLTKFCTGRLRPKVQPLTLSYTILAENIPLLYTFN